MGSDHIREVTQIETNLEPDFSGTYTGEPLILPGVRRGQPPVKAFCWTFFEILKCMDGRN